MPNGKMKKKIGTFLLYSYFFLYSFFITQIDVIYMLKIVKIKNIRNEPDVKLDGYPAVVQNAVLYIRPDTVYLSGYLANILPVTL